MSCCDFNAPGPAFVRLTNATEYDEDVFLRSLARADVASRGPPDASLVVSGAFAALPAELIDAICVELLIGRSRHQGRTRTTRHYASLVTACRWVRASVSRRVTLEAKCIHLSQMGHALPVLPLGVSYVDYAKMAIRSRLEAEMLCRYFKKVSFHCADPTAECCRGLRAELNDDLHQAPVSVQFPLGSLGAEALGEHTGRRVSVVAPSGARLLCATPGGALLCNDERVWSVTSEPAAEFAPGYELATTFSTSRINHLVRGQIWGAAQGTLIAVCEPLPDCNNTMYSLRIFENGRLVAEAKMSNQDPSFRGEGMPQTIWIHDGEVCILWLHRAANWCHARLMWIHPDEAHCPENEWSRTAYRYANVVNMSVATDAGHVAILHSDGVVSGSNVQLYFYDMKNRKGYHLPTPCRLGGYVGHELRLLLHSITLSPDGKQMVLLDRTPNNPLIVTYKRDVPDAYPDRSKWRVVTTLQPTGCAELALKHGYLAKVVFTPCGRRVFAFFMGNAGYSRGGVLEIGSSLLLSPHREDVYPLHGKHLCRYTVSWGDTPDVPANAAWSNDGLFVATWSGGVLRMGLVA